MLFFLQDKIIDVNKVSTLLQNMGMNFTEKEISNLTHNLPGDGKYLRHIWIAQGV